MNNKERARILVTITEEQWEAILDASTQSAFEKILKDPLKAESGCDNNPENELRFKVVNLIKEIGVPPHYLGYNYLQDAVMLAYEDERYIHNIVKGLYVVIAEKHEATPGRVERALRNALETACLDGDPVVLKKVFGAIPERITNSYAIASMVEYLKMHN